MSTQIGESDRPSAKAVGEFHTNADVDQNKESLHHTLGTGANQASPGSHRHDGTDSFAILEGVILSGSRASGEAMASVISALVLLGAADETSA